MSVDYRPTLSSVAGEVGRVSADSDGRVSVKCWSSIGRDIDRHSRSSVDRVSAEMSVEYRPRYRPTLSVECWPRYRPTLSVECWPSVGGDVGRVSAEISAKCRPRCRSSIG